MVNPIMRCCTWLCCWVEEPDPRDERDYGSMRPREPPSTGEGTGGEPMSADPSPTPSVEGGASSAVLQNSALRGGASATAASEMQDVPLD